MLASLPARAAGPHQAQPETVDPSALTPAQGMVTLDYRKLTLKDGGKFDLIGVHYLHALNDWLYLGFGINGPLVEGAYGGFFTVDTTLAAQKKLSDHWFVQAGLAYGGGGGGASVRQIKALSGSGRYLKKHVGLGYEFGGVQYSVNYSSTDMADSPIKGAGLGIQIQKPLSFRAGSLADAGKRVVPGHLNFRDHDSIVSVELGQMTQINPKGSYRGTIGLVSPQFSQFFSKENYLYFGFDLGVTGLDWYNQIHGGVGRKIALSPNWNLYAQLGLGSGGWVTDTIDTGPGLLVYPKLKAEYLWDKDTGLSLSAGYLAAPKGSSRNVVVGLALNSRLSGGASGAGNTDHDTDHDTDLTLHGLRAHLYHNALRGLNHNGRDRDQLTMSVLQVDSVINQNLYIPVQIGGATSAFNGYAGYAEMFAGLGWHSASGKKLQTFAQLMIGLNDLGVNKQEDPGPLLNASVGMNYELSERFAIYGQLGKTASINRHLRPRDKNNFESTSVGLGLSYRFSLPNRTTRYNRS